MFTQRPIELLAPAKNLECGIAAIDHGADAVYIGAPRYGARASAGNSVTDIRTLADYAHLFRARIYVTVNTILRDKFDRGEQIHINDIIAAARNDDNLSIELIEEVGEKLGKAVAFLINIFNPEMVIIGGNLSYAGDYLMLPLKQAKL